ncbi:MAG: hypothetical protein ACXWUN_01870 [Allosphingosinicella sp.]
MRVSKRQFLAGSLAAGAGLALAARHIGLGPNVDEAERSDLAIYDGRTLAGRRFAARARLAGIATVDMAANREDFWRRAQSGFGLADGASVIGVTDWDARVYLAGALAGRRMRVRREVRLAARAPDRDFLFAWRIA